jgi:hypothetical protein
VSWQRIEAATVDPDLDQGLEARIADPYWLLARQWQTGEFGGEDAANPLFMSIRGRCVPLDSVRIGGRPVDRKTALDAPLEPVVEREPVRGGPAGARVAAELGQLLLRSLAVAEVPIKWRNALRASHPVRLPADDGLDPEGRRRLELLGRLSLDGVAAAAAVAPQAVLSTLPALAAAPAAVKTKLDAVGRAWLPLARGAFSEPGAQRAWAPSRMEYRFSVGATTAAGPLELSADGYCGGRLEWYHFDWRSGSGFGPGETAGEHHSADLLPAPLRFRGMPASRFWEFENADVYFGGIDAAPEDLARVAVSGYATLYGDDWYVIPIRLQAGTLAQVEALTVVDDFGRETPVAAAAVRDGPRRAFRFFEITGDPGPARGAAPLLLIPPTVETTDAARPLEDVRFLRDEAANLAWAVEHRVESVTGRPVDLAARGGAPTSPAAENDRWRFVLSTDVPDNWVPLVPVRIGDEAGPIAFQRGRIEGRGARGHLLEPKTRLLINEEEVPREGARVVRRFQSARGPDGRLHVWIGRRKGPGRGEGSSRLVFDTIDRGV